MKSKFYLLLVIILSVSSVHSYGQGCVAVRNMASSCSLSFDSTMSKGSWQFSANYRYFHSYKHFVGNDEQTHRVTEGTNVINDDNSILFGAQYALNKHWSFSVIVPMIYINRSSLYEHMGNNSGERYSTHSQGIGDVRVAAYYGIIPQNHKRALTVGLGVKMPTGNYNYKDYFHKADGLTLLPVDQSIQPGDGGWGITTEVDFMQMLGSKTSIYVTGLYLFNPRNTNGVARRPNLTNGIPFSNEFSVADQFLVRAGVGQQLNNFNVSLGGRFEGVAVQDVFGESDGFRRPGFILSIEPSVNYTMKKHTFAINVPIALLRNRTQSVMDQKRTEITGQHTHGDAAFADWLLSLTYAYRL